METKNKFEELNAGQLNKFVQKLGLQDLRWDENMECWFADDVIDDRHFPIAITEDLYWAAWYEGDLA